MKKAIAFVLMIGCLLALVGCGSKENAVFVQSVAELTGRGGIAPGDRFSCMVVSENVAEIQKDGEKSVLELYVKEGDDVKKGDKLFSYDTEELKLSLEKQELEQEQLETSIENYTNEIASLEKDRERAGTRDKLQYTVQIQTMQVDLKEAQLNLKTKKAEVKKSKEILKNADVVSPVNGRVQAVNENGTDSNGQELPYITIQQSGSYRVKGTIGELQRGGITEGSRVKMVSRMDATQVWGGTVTLVDYENPIQNNQNVYYTTGAGDEMSAASKYPFYVALDSIDGLILGQHLYLELDSGEDTAMGLELSASFVSYEDNGAAYVWADNGKGKLEKRGVAVGTENPDMGTVTILSGLTDSDYIAFPDEECRAGLPTTKVMPAADSGSDGAQFDGGAAELGGELGGAEFGGEMSGEFYAEDAEFDDDAFFVDEGEVG